jgi:hypothetical protein
MEGIAGLVGMGPICGHKTVGKSPDNTTEMKAVLVAGFRIVISIFRHPA